MKESNHQLINSRDQALGELSALQGANKEGLALLVEACNGLSTRVAQLRKKTAPDALVPDHQSLPIIVGLIKKKTEKVNNAKNILALQLKSDKHRVSRRGAAFVMAAYAEANPSATMPDWASVSPSSQSRREMEAQAAVLAGRDYPRLRSPEKPSARPTAQKQ